VAGGTLTIRARVKSDLEALRRDFLPAMGAVVDGGGTDYPYRAKAPRDEIAEAVARLVRHIGYSNFKNEVAARQGKQRAERYGPRLERALRPGRAASRLTTPAARAPGPPQFN
jgi:hypothetical protein